MGNAGWFTAPYVFSRWPDEIDAYEHLAIVGSGVRVRSGPSTSSDPIISLTFSIVQRAESTGPDEEWVLVRTPGGVIGHVARQFVRSPLDYRAIFAKTSGQRRMKVLIAGD